MDDVNFIRIAFLILHLLEVIVESKECLKNEDIGWREGNIYNCDDPEKSECCEKDFTFTCCEPAAETKLREQLQLFGVIALFVMILFVIYMYLKKDVQVFTSPTLKESILSVFRRQKKENNTEENHVPAYHSRADGGVLQKEHFSYIDRGNIDSVSDFSDFSCTDSDESSNEYTTPTHYKNSNFESNEMKDINRHRVEYRSEARHVQSSKL